MRVATAVLLATVSLATAAPTITITREEYNQIWALVKQQEQEIYDAKGRISWTWIELQKAQGEVGKVAKERDDYKQYGDEVEQRWVNAEQRVAKAQRRIAIDNMIFGIIGIAIVVLGFLKFGLKAAL